MDNRTEVVPDKTMDLLIRFFVDDNELRVVIFTAASLQEPLGLTGDHEPGVVGKGTVASQFAQMPW